MKRSTRSPSELALPDDAIRERRHSSGGDVRAIELGDIALVADQIAGQRRDRCGVMDIARGQLQGDDLIAVVKDEVQFEAKEPAHRSLAALGQIDKDLVPANAMIIARAVESM